MRADITKSEDSIERYLLAFEAKTLPEASCGDRVRDLADKVAKLRIRRTELIEELDPTPTSEAIDIDHQALKAT